jgi:hypothetical protein
LGTREKMISESFTLIPKLQLGNAYINKKRQLMGRSRYKIYEPNYIITQNLSFKIKNYYKWFAFSKMDGDSLSILRRLK